MTSISTRAALLLPVLLVAAGCSSDSAPFFPEDGQAPIEGPPEQLQITASNAPLVAALVYQSAVRSTQGGAFAVEIGSGLGGGAAKPSGPGIALKGIPALVVQVPFGPLIVDCTSGSIALSGDIADPTGLSAGDTIRLVHQACEEGGATVTGVVDAVVDEFTPVAGLPDNYLLGLLMELSDLQVTVGSSSETSNGDVAVLIDTTNAPASLSEEAAGNSMRFDGDNRSDTLRNYATNATYNFDGEVYLFSVITQGTVSSTAIEQPVTYTTPVALEGVEGDFPSSGELLTSGDASSVRIVAVDNINVRLDVDSNGDGEVDVSIETTWTDLIN